MRAGSEHETSTRGSPAEVTGHIILYVKAAVLVHCVVTTCVP